MGWERVRRRGVLGATLLALAIVLCLHASSARADDAGGHLPSAADRYSLANGCFALRSLQTGDFVAKSGGGYAANAASGLAAELFRMQATDLGRYLFYGAAPDFMARGGGGQAVPAAAPSDASDWTVEEDDGGFRIVNDFTGHDLVVGAGDALVTVPAGSGGAAGLFDFDQGTGCADYPEIEVNVDGPLPPEGSPDTPVRGLIETHMHQMAYEFLGTKAHCGQPWHRFGAPSALVDCVDHRATPGPTGGCGAILEAALSGTTCHDPGGWPTFAGWPEHYQYTHEQSYYKWLERSWRGGLRIFVNLLVENRILCQIYPLTPPGQNCDEMVTVRREAQRMRELERYIDAQNGGPGKGWYRIVESPAEARQVIADGKLAVVMGMEVSEPFGCIRNALTDTSQCSEEELDAGIDEVYDLGVRQLELVNKFDNSLTGVAGDSGTTGTITNGGNFLSTQSFWDYEHCDDTVNNDNSPTALSHNDDQVIANGLALLPISLPVYGPPPHCNQLGLSELGDRAIRRIMDKGMIFDPDHMSVIGRNSALDILEEERYAGVMTSHSWSTDNALPRIAALGGLIGPAAKSPQGFVDEWAHIKAQGYDQLNPYLVGFGYGADMNGFASQGGPPSDPITYPFQSPIDPNVTVDRQQSGQRTFDLNTDGTAHYGLYADWAEAVRVAGGQEIIDDMANGPEAYLQMWERATGVSGAPGSGETPGGGPTTPEATGPPDGCTRWPRRIKRKGIGQRLRLGYDSETALTKAGQPQTRGRAWVWCAQRRAGGPKRRVVAVFGASDQVELIASTVGRSRAGKLGRGSKVAELRVDARRVGGGIWVRPAGAGKRYFYRVRRGKVAYTGVVAAGAAGRSAIKRSLALAGLR